jgi:hypothetical protein
MAYKPKSAYTPEEWAVQLEKARASQRRNKETILAKAKVRNATPEEKERRREYDARPEVKAKRKAREASDEHREYLKRRWEELKADPVKYREHLDKMNEWRTGHARHTFDALLISQDNKCAVCGRSFEGRQIRRDHDHDTKLPRGLLCHHCNIIEGMIKSMELCPEEYGRRLRHYLSNPPIRLVKNK